MRALYGPRVWAGPIVYLIALLGTWLLANESARPWAVLLLIASAVLAVVLWGRQNWISAFPSDATARTHVNRSRLFYLFGVTIAMLLVLAADLRYAAAPSETFGLAGILWIAGMALLLCSAFGVPRLRGSGEPSKGGTPNQCRRFSTAYYRSAPHPGRLGRCVLLACCSSWRCSVEFGT